KKKTSTSATTDVEDVGEKAATFEENIDATQESEVVAAKEKFRPRIQRKRRKDVISPAFGENLVEEEEVENKENEGLEVSKRRRLKMETSNPVAETKDSEEAQTDEDVQRLAFDSDMNREG
ncbi:hypothetical protein Dimus_010778, partial [Dionaea muscipula]